MLSSWLERTARLYDLPVKDLLTHNLGQLDVIVPEEVDWDPPAWMLAALAERAGTGLAQLRAMTLAGWVPWLMDTLHTLQREAQQTFDTYIRQNSVLLGRGEAGRNQVSGQKRWGGPWWPARPVKRLCPVCVTGADPRRALVWHLPLTVGCFDHGCRLKDAREIDMAAAGGEKPQPVPVAELLAALDRYTYEGLITGRVTLPGRGVHVGVWFRLLRSLLDEVSLALSPRSASTRVTLERIWRATGRPERGGLNVWRPYEQMDWPMQEAILRAAATALQLAAAGQIAARGTLGSALQPAPHRHVYDGDQPSPRPSAWPEAMAEVPRWQRSATRVGSIGTIGCQSPASASIAAAYRLFAGVSVPCHQVPVRGVIGRRHE